MRYQIFFLYLICVNCHLLARGQEVPANPVAVGILTSKGLLACRRHKIHIGKNKWHQEPFLKMIGSGFNFSFYVDYVYAF